MTTPRRAVADPFLEPPVNPQPSDRPTHPKRQTFVLLAGVFVVVLLLALISTLAA